MKEPLRHYRDRPGRPGRHSRTRHMSPGAGNSRCWRYPFLRPATGRVPCCPSVARPRSSTTCRLVWAWGLEVWRVWAPHHATIRGWNTLALSKPGT